MKRGHGDNDLSVEGTNYVLVQIASVAMAFAWSVSIARWLGPSGHGFIGVVLAIATVASQVFSLGVNQGAIYLVGQGRGGASVYSAVIIFAVFMMGALFFGALVSAGIWIPDNEDSPGRVATLAASLVIAFTFLWTLLDPMLIGFKFVAVRNRSKLLYEAGRLALTFGLLFFAFERDYAIALWAITVSYLFAFLVAFSHLERRIGFRAASVDACVVKGLLRYGAKLYPGNVLQLAAYRVDIFIVTAILGTSHAGQYLVATQLAEMFWLVPSAVGILIFRRVSAGDESWPPLRVAALARQTILALAAIAALAAPMAVWLIPFLFGEAFSGAVAPFLWLLPGALSICLHKVLVFAVLGAGRPHFMTLSGFTLFVLVIGLDLMLIPRFGLSGAALASTIAYLCSALLTSAYFSRTFQISMREMLVPRWSDVTALGLFVREQKKRMF